MASAAPNDRKTTGKYKLEVVGHVTIQPNEMEKICLGRFRTGDPHPRFHVHYYPQDAPHVVSYHDSCVEHDDNTYALYRHFQNFGDKACTLTVKRAR